MSFLGTLAAYLLAIYGGMYGVDRLIERYAVPDTSVEAGISSAVEAEASEEP